MFASILLSILYRGNIWLLYNSYHKNKSQWKKKIWNYYMEKHAASISIDAIIAAQLQISVAYFCSIGLYFLV